jgi:hypothetical protein
MNFFKMVAQSKLVELLLFLMVLWPYAPCYGQISNAKKGTDISAMRTAYSYLEENENGSFTSTSYSHPVHYQTKDGFLPIDLRISNNEDNGLPNYKYVNATNSYKHLLFTSRTLSN